MQKYTLYNGDCLEYMKKSMEILLLKTSEIHMKNVNRLLWLP